MSYHQRRWRIVEVPEELALETDLTDSELIGVSILLTHQSGEPRDEMNVYWRARQRIQYAVGVAIERANE